MSTNNKKEEAKKAAAFLTGLFTGWGMPANWAKAISGFIIGGAIGAAIAAGLLSSCTTTYTQSADGDISWEGTIIIPCDNCQK